jgi:DNA-binding transcriptional MocR family regulator
MQPENALSWLRDLDPQGGPRFLQIVQFIEDAVASGRLSAGTRLTPQRAVAKRLGVDLTTVTRAYDEARKRRLLVAEGARGTFISSRKIELAPVVDMSLNIPPPPSDLDLAALLRHGLQQVLLQSDVDLLMTYHLGGGSAMDRIAAARWLTPMLGDTDPELVTATPGAQAALSALILSMTAPGDVLLCEPSIYPGFRAAATQLGRRVEDVECDDAGMNPDALERACARRPARVVYLNPTIQNPTTVTMPERRRKAIGKLAARLDLQIIEDDPYWLLADEAPPPVARFAQARTHYVSTLSKCLSPGLRTAFVRSPDAGSRSKLGPSLRSFSLMRAPLMAVLVTQWIHDGTADRLLEAVRSEARTRQRLAAGMHLGSAAPNMSREGIHLWQELPSYWSAHAFASEARQHGLAVTPANAFAGPSDVPAAIRISLGGGTDRRQLALGLARLSSLLATPPPLQDSRNVV